MKFLRAVFAVAVVALGVVVPTSTAGADPTVDGIPWCPKMPQSLPAGGAPIMFTLPAGPVSAANVADCARHGWNGSWTATGTPRTIYASNTLVCSVLLTDGADIESLRNASPSWFERLGNFGGWLVELLSDGPVSGLFVDFSCWIHLGSASLTVDGVTPYTMSGFFRWAGMGNISAQELRCDERKAYPGPNQNQITQVGPIANSDLTYWAMESDEWLHVQCYNQVTGSHWIDNADTLRLVGARVDAAEGSLWIPGEAHEVGNWGDCWRGANKCRKIRYQTDNGQCAALAYATSAAEGGCGKKVGIGDPGSFMLPRPPDPPDWVSQNDMATCRLLKITGPDLNGTTLSGGEVLEFEVAVDSVTERPPTSGIVTVTLGPRLDPIVTQVSIPGTILVTVPPLEKPLRPAIAFDFDCGGDGVSTYYYDPSGEGGVPSSVDRRPGFSGCVTSKSDGMFDEAESGVLEGAVVLLICGLRALFEPSSGLGYHVAAAKIAAQGTAYDDLAGALSSGHRVLTVFRDGASSGAGFSVNVPIVGVVSMPTTPPWADTARLALDATVIVAAGFWSLRLILRSLGVRGGDSGGDDD